MATLSLRQAAEQAGTSKSTIFRAIKAGRLSAARTDDGNFAIDPAELFRVYPPRRGEAVAAEHSAQCAAGQDATAVATAPVAPELATKVAVLEAELRGMIYMAKELRQSRDQWQAQAERVTLVLAGPSRRPWWRRLAG